MKRMLRLTRTRAMKFVVVCGLFLFSLASFAAGEGGGWGSSGGGSGVICFATASDAPSDNLELKDLKKMTSLETLDYWEWKQKKTYSLLELNESKSYSEILSQIKRHAEISVPIITYRLNQSDQLVGFSKWNENTNVEVIHDAHPSTALPDNCRLVQLVARYARKKYEPGNGPPSDLPIVKVDFNENLFQLLDPLNQAILVLHEEIYLLGQLTGHTDSDPIRPLVMRYLAQDIDSSALRRDFVSQLGDYILFFAKETQIAAVPLSQESRFNSYLRMLNQIRSNIDQCEVTHQLSKKPTTQQDISEHMKCKDIAMDPDNNSAWMDEEESFLFIGYFFLDIASHFTNSETMIAPLQDLSFKTKSTHDLNSTCRAIDYLKNKIKYTSMTNKALSYCDKLKAAKLITGQ